MFACQNFLQQSCSKFYKEQKLFYGHLMIMITGSSKVTHKSNLRLFPTLCSINFENFITLRLGTNPVCSIDFENFITLNPGRSSSCSSWQSCRSWLVLQLCQLRHLLTRSGLGANRRRSCSVSRWSRVSIQSWARRRGYPDRHLSARCRPYAGDGPAESPSLVLDNWWNPSTNLYTKCV